MPTLKNIISILWIGLFLPSLSLSQSVPDDSVAVEGLLRVQLEGEDVSDLNRWKREDMYVSAKWRVEREVETELLSRGHISYNKIERVVGDTTVLTYEVGPIYRWGSLVVSDEVRWVLAKAGVRHQRLSRGAWSKTRFNAAMERSIGYLENHGFPFAELTLDSVHIEDGEIHARLSIDKGRYVRFDSVVITGDLEVRKAYLTNYLGVKEGSAYDERAVRDIPDRLRGVRFVQQVRPPLVSFEEDVTKLNLFLNRRSASTFDGIVGFLPNPSDGSLLITGDVKLHLENALKQGETLDLNWRKLQARTQELKAAVITPYVFNSSVSIEGGLNIYRRDTLFSDVMRKLGLRFGYGAGNYLRLFFDRQTTSLISTSAYSSGGVPSFLDRAINTYGVGLFMQKLDRILSPSRGYHLEINLGLGDKQILRNQRLPEVVYNDVTMRSLQWRGDMKASYFVSPIKRWVWHQQMLSAGLLNDQLFNNEASRIGGLITLRGFDEESIFATSYAILRNELRFQLGQDGYLFGFFDGAWYENASLNRIGARRDTPFGFGAGIAFGTPAGNFTLSYSLGSQLNNPILLRASKVHFGFVSVF